MVAHKLPRPGVTTETRWPGALDGKHILMSKMRVEPLLKLQGLPINGPLALVDADYTFTTNHIAAGYNLENQIFQYKELQRIIADSTSATSFVDASPKVHYYILTDDALQPRTWLMNPFSHRTFGLNERIFNYQIRHGRRLVENGFGIAGSRIQMLQSPMQ